MNDPQFPQRKANKRISDSSNFLNAKSHSLNCILEKNESKIIFNSHDKKKTNKVYKPNAQHNEAELKEILLQYNTPQQI